MKRPAFAVLLGVVIASVAASAAAQQLYRWTDDKGRTHITDTPPPASAKNVQKSKAPASGGGEAPAVPFELAAAMKDYPVVLYTAPSCKEACAEARAALNKRAVPFREVQVWNDATNEELKKVSNGNTVPTIVVGRSVVAGFRQEDYDALLDSARYPRAGILPARNQAAPAAPDGYVAPGSPVGEAPKAEPVAPVADETPKGPYSPGAPPQRATPRATLKKAQ